MTEFYASDGTPMREVTMTLKLLVRDDETKQMARDVRRVLASRKALRRLLTSIVTIGVEGPEMFTRQPRQAYQCHDCCPPGEPCPHGEDEFCDCDHEDATTSSAPSLCPGCTTPLGPEANHAEGCAWLRGVKAGVADLRAGRITLWTEVERELGINHAEDLGSDPIEPTTGRDSC